MSAIFIDGQLAHYEVIGRGKPILFIHGWVGSWRYWVPTMQSISTTKRTYALDLWGFGDSAKNNRYSIKHQTDLIASFINQIGFSQVSIIGHGLGAILAYEVEASYPDLVEKIMTIAFPLKQSLLNHKLLSGESIGLFEKLLGKGVEMDAVRKDEPKNDPNAVKISLNELENLEIQNLWKTLSKTNLMVFGQKDPVVHLPEIDDFPKLPTNFHTISFDNSGHFPMLDESSKFSRLLSEFLELGEDDSPKNLEIKEKWQRKIR
jgi:pimeloyl-ACP methyl ester carboxylesterase